MLVVEHAGLDPVAAVVVEEQEEEIPVKKESLLSLLHLQHGLYDRSPQRLKGKAFGAHFS